MRPQLVMLAGPNGAGKSTFYELYLSASPLPFLNADLVAAALDIDSFEAARVLDVHRERMIEDRLGFITETVFSDPQGAKLDMLRRAISVGYEVKLLYIGIGSAELSARRVDQRVARGGHDVPRDRLAGRFVRSLQNLRHAIPVASTVKIYDNSSFDEPFRLVAAFETGVLAYRVPGRLPTWCRGIVPAARRR